MVPGFVGDDPESTPRSEAAGVIAANAVPLVGVGALGWQAATLILLYWVEFSVVLLGALVRAAFAGRPAGFDDDLLVLGALARRPLHATVPRTDIGVRISSVPVLLIATPLLALLWFAVSGVTIGVVGVAEPKQPEWLLGLAALTIVVAEAGRTGFEYFYQRAYREHNPDRTSGHPVPGWCTVLYRDLCGRRRRSRRRVRRPQFAIPARSGSRCFSASSD